MAQFDIFLRGRLFLNFFRKKLEISSEFSGNFRGKFFFPQKYRPPGYFAMVVTGDTDEEDESDDECFQSDASLESDESLHGDSDYVDSDDENDNRPALHDVNTDTEETAEEEAGTSTGPLSDYEMQRAQTIRENAAMLTELGLHDHSLTSKNKSTTTRSVQKPGHKRRGATKRDQPRATKKPKTLKQHNTRALPPDMDQVISVQDSNAHQRIALSIPSPVQQPALYRIEFERGDGDNREIIDGVNGSNAVAVANRVYNEQDLVLNAVLPCGKPCVIGYSPDPTIQLYCWTMHEDGIEYPHRLKLCVESVLPQLPKYSNATTKPYVLCERCCRRFATKANGAIRKHICR